jgi:hypothetical protein
LASALRRFAAIVTSPSDREDLEQYLLATAWEISLTFKPGRGSVGFSTYASNTTPIVNGYSVTEIARATRTTRSWVLTRLDELREELERPG